MELTLGVDVSRWNDKVDWKILKAAGVEFAIVKCSQGTHGQDKMVRTHLEAAQAAGMITGVYHWCDPSLYDGPQLENFTKIVENLEIIFRSGRRRAALGGLARVF
jgi:lysozyme